MNEDGEKLIEQKQNEAYCQYSIGLYTRFNILVE